MTSNLDNHKSKYSLIPYIGAAIIGVSIIWFNYTNFTSPSKYIKSSNAHRASGNYKSALDDLNTAIKLDSKNPQLYIDKAIQLNAKNATTYNNRAFLRYDLGDKQGAIKDWQQAANLYLQQGDTKKYLETIERIKLIQ
ncbi:tetratricopeptide repeat protein [Nostoc sp. GT001]|uniref:tetratricopeptide repeat protein n=1 Tax=Nostoc sp. GT001 TaxID=3056647 RepID=UPI0025AAE347|nr:tetratricopeptide repeat protein [Nostoc sp. GT001]MDM9581274.1 tetratricopeptide repeat protein [Nostoc sp. GT001]